MTSATYSRLLVTVQFALFAVIVALWVFIPARTLPVLALIGTVLILGGVCVLASAILAFRRAGAISPGILPEPRAGASLVTQGIYGYIRHPIYTAVILCGMGIAAIHGGGEMWVIVGALLIVFHFKSRHEEKLLAATFPEYSAYQNVTGRFFPSIQRLKQG